MHKRSEIQTLLHKPRVRSASCGTSSKSRHGYSDLVVNGIDRECSSGQQQQTELVTTQDNKKLDNLDHYIDLENMKLIEIEP